MAGDMQLTCSDCGQDFTFTAADQAFFRNAVIRPQSVASLAVRQRKTIRGDPATVRLLHRELL